MQHFDIYISLLMYRFSTNNSYTVFFLLMKVVIAASTVSYPWKREFLLKSESFNILALVGKGLTVDSGGYNIKTGPGCSIETMKVDMGGSAAVFGAAKALGQIKPPGVESVTYHFISGAGIVTASNGKTIEVNNADAEGRLTLTDALVYACNQGVEKAFAGHLGQIMSSSVLTSASCWGWRVLWKRYVAKLLEQRSFTCWECICNVHGLFFSYVVYCFCLHICLLPRC
ncbi:hypothetical protein GQ457_06G043090 [Hibiscus cannabinus]